MPCLLLFLHSASGLVLPQRPPAVVGMATASARAFPVPTMGLATARAGALAVPAMQVEAPVKVPDKVPNFAPSKPQGDTASNKGKKHKVLLFNDNVNRREYVAKVLTRSIPDYSQADAYIVMQKAHKQGMAVVGIWAFELAEAYCELLKAGGLIASVTEED